MSNNKSKVYITQTLLNSWQYVLSSDADKVQDAYNDFINTLNKIHTPPNFFMERGIQFEQDCVDGKVEVISDLIKGGVFQATGTKVIEVDNVEILLYGKLDCLKAGIIYDIKRVSKYETPKYFNSYQHHLYMELIPEAIAFTYLINDGEQTYIETYRRDEVKPMAPVIHHFFNWLKERNLFGVFQEKWKSKEKEK